MRSTVKVSDIIRETICVACEDGQKVFEVLRQAILENRQICVSFEGISWIIPAFLNAAIGQLYGEFSENKIDAIIAYTHLEEDDRALLLIVIDKAQRYYRNQEGYNNAMQEVLD